MADTTVNEKTPLDPLIKNTLIGGAVGLGQSLFNAGLSQIAANQEYNRQVEQWHRQNAYNSPLEQRLRFQQAGMNPSAVTGEIAQSQPAGQLSSVPGNEVMKNGVFDLSSMVESLKSLSEIENIAASTDSLSADVAMKLLEYEIQSLYGKDKAKADALIAKYRARFEHQRERFAYDQFTAEIESLRAGANQANAAAGLADEQKDDLIATRQSRIDKNIAEGKYSEALAETEDQLREAKQLYMQAQTDEAKAAAFKAYRDAELSRVRAEYEPLDSASLRQLNKGSYEEKQQIVRELKATFRDRLSQEASKANLLLSEEAIAEHQKKINDAVEALAEPVESLEDLQNGFQSLYLLIGNVLAGASLNAGDLIPGVETKPNVRRIGY